MKYVLLQIKMSPCVVSFQHSGEVLWPTAGGADFDINADTCIKSVNLDPKINWEEESLSTSSKSICVSAQQ